MFQLKQLKGTVQIRQNNKTINIAGSNNPNSRKKLLNMPTKKI